MARGGWIARTAHGALARLVAGWLALCWRTTRWRVEGAGHAAALLAQGGPFLAVFWHGRLAFSPLWAPPGRRTVAVISANRDGDLFAAIAARFGVESLRGSSADPRKPDRDKGGMAAAIAGIRALRNGAVVSFGVDGPRGPLMRAQPGVAAMAAAAGVAVQPIAFSTRRGLRLNSWDRFVLPLPFDRGVMVYAPTLPAPARGDPATLAAYIVALEAALNAATAQADALAGRTPVTPA